MISSRLPIYVPFCFYEDANTDTGHKCQQSTDTLRKEKSMPTAAGEETPQLQLQDNAAQSLLYLDEVFVGTEPPTQAGWSIQG